MQSPDFSGPSAMADMVVIGERYSRILSPSLSRLNIRPIWLPDNMLVDDRLAGHADLSLFYPGGDRIWLAPCFKDSNFARQLEGMSFQISYPDIRQESSYPNDAQLNISLCGKWAICRLDNVPDEIVKILTSKFQIINCRQGYAKCSVCVVSDSAIITADRGIEAAVRRESELDVLLISPGFIELAGFDYGFIGGASFKISSDKLAFTGRLDGHKNKTEILDFLKKHNVEPVYLTERPVFDIGSAIPV